MTLERHLAITFFAALVSALSFAASGQMQPRLLGILEDNPGHYAGNLHYRDVRVVFRKEGTRWFAFPSNCPDQDCLKTIAAKFPAQVNWTISFDGKQVGQVISKAPPTFDFYATVGQQTIVGDTPPPTIGKVSTDFAGFLGEPVYRPLVAISQPNYRDPENWKPTQLSTATTAAVRKAFRSRFPKVANCSQQDMEHAKPWPYTDANVEIDKAYGSNRHWLIAEVALSGNDCDGLSDEAFSSQWFVITPEQRVRFLDSNMWLVDAGDYDKDGKSELVFSIDDYNRGGYKLFYDDFSKHAIFEFGYH
jgi:hypothetical protein